MAGGGQAILCGIRFANATRTWQALEDIDVTGWVVDTPFIVATGIETDSGVKCADALSLEWRNATDGGTFAALSGTGELTWSGITDLVNANAVVVGEAGTTAGTGDTWQDGTEHEGSNDANFDSANVAGRYTEYQYAVVGGVAGKEYEFRVWDTTDGVSAGTGIGTITMAAGAETYTETADIDALLKSIGATNTTQLDSFLSKTFSIDLSIDSLLNMVVEQNLNLDAVLKLIGYIRTTNIDSLLKALSTENIIDIDAILTKVITETISTDAILKALLSTDLNLDALIKAILSIPLSIDAILTSQVLKTMNIDALLKLIGTDPIILDAVLKQLASTKEINLDAILSNTLSEFISIDTLLKILNQSNIINIDAILLSSYIDFISIDALLKVLNIESNISIDAVLYKYGITITSNFDAILTTEGEITIVTSIDSVLKAESLLYTCNLNAILMKIAYTSLSIDAVLQKQFITTVVMDAIIKKLNQTNTINLDTFLQIIGSENINIDTILKTIGQTKIISLDAVIQDIASGGTETINIDAILAILGVTTTNIDSILIKILINFKLSDRNRITSFNKNRSRSFKITDRR